MMIVNGKRTFKVGKDKRSQGMSVRCVREKSGSTSAVRDIAVDDTDSPAPVYNLQGMIVRENVRMADATEGLAPGVYMVGSRKVLVR